MLHNNAFYSSAMGLVITKALFVYSQQDFASEGYTAAVDSIVSIQTLDSMYDINSKQILYY